MTMEVRLPQGAWTGVRTPLPGGMRRTAGSAGRRAVEAGAALPPLSDGGGLRVQDLAETLACLQDRASSSQTDDYTGVGGTGVLLLFTRCRHNGSASLKTFYMNVCPQTHVVTKYSKREELLGIVCFVRAHLWTRVGHTEHTGSDSGPGAQQGSGPALRSLPRCALPGVCRSKVVGSPPSS